MGSMADKCKQDWRGLERLTAARVSALIRGMQARKGERKRQRDSSKLEDPCGNFKVISSPEDRSLMWGTRSYRSRCIGGRSFACVVQKR
eukprot:6209962-Pleurochrysis_carterae.AAC.3